ncbi:hypothetical protein SDC9_211580 [bioreactor metagenome]|uniref:Uncharacterized protein n=1 Tax=bioreactor metagenome TaxID=1076179 RepID=A0A645JVU4_9ZZZZ
MVGGYPAEQIGGEFSAPHARSVAGDDLVLCRGELGPHFVVSEADAGEVHHFAEMCTGAFGAKFFYLAGFDVFKGRLLRGGRNAGGRSVIEIYRESRAFAVHEAYPLHAAGVRYLVRVRHHRRRAVR